MIFPNPRHFSAGRTSSQHPEVNLRLAEFYFAEENYGFVFQNNSDLLERLNVALVKLKEQGVIEQIKIKYLEID